MCLKRGKDIEILPTIELPDLGHLKNVQSTLLSVLDKNQELVMVTYLDQKCALRALLSYQTNAVYTSPISCGNS